MRIYIPTYGRSNEQTTWKYFADNPALLEQYAPTLVVQEREAHLYDAYPAVHVLPRHIQTIAPTRQHILEELVPIQGNQHFCMLDDDLLFYKRRDDDRGKLRDLLTGELEELFHTISEALMDYAHVGIAAREGANRNTDHFQYNTRIMRVLAYKGAILKLYKLRFDDVDLMEDHHINLSLMKQGCDTIVLNNWANNQAHGSGAKGGCTHQRDIHAQNAASQHLADLHSPFVTTVQKETKGAWGGGIRTDVRVQWKRARQSANTC